MNRGLLLLMVLSLETAFGLDPNRTLTQYVHRIWQRQQGLPQATISAIWQTQDGYLWLGTQSGLVRFDGVRFTSVENVYRNAPANIWVREILEDSNHTLWVGTNDAGLIRLENDRVTTYSTKNGLPSDTVQCLVSTRNGDLWACTPEGLARITGGTVQVYGTGQGLGSNNVRAACETGDGTLWAGGENARLSMWNGTGFISRQLTSVPGDAGVRALTCSGDVLWIGTTSGLIELKDGHERLFTVKNELADNWVLCLAVGRDGSLWIGTRNGFSRVRNSEVDTFRPQDGLSQSTVYSLFEDREGSLWVGTKHGLNQFLDGRAVPYTMNEGLPSNDAGPLLQDRRGKIWVGTLGAGLARFDGRRFSVLTTAQGLLSNSIVALSEDGGGGLWVGTDHGLNRLQDGRVAQTYTTAQGLPANQIRSLFRERSGTLWVGTSAGPAAFENGKFLQPAVLQSSMRDPILAIGEDRDRRLLFATARGGFFYSGGKIGELRQENAPLRAVDAFFLDQNGLLWMGMMGGGLRLLDREKVFSYFTRDGLFDNEIYGIAEDNQDRLWMACSKGIFSVPRSDLRRFAAGEIKRFNSSPYSPTDALRVIECKPGVQPAVARMLDGRIWFSTIRGLIVLDPQHLQRNVPPPPVVIEEVTVNGERKGPDVIAKLPPGQKNLEFRYTGLSFLAAGRITFRYMLEGYDKDWIAAGTRREAFYTNLPSGHFRFRVTACNSDGVCNETGDAVAFALASHYYQRIWFLPLCAVLLGLAILLAYQFRIRRLREQFSLILTERNRIARELHDTLMQGFSGITMEMQALAGRMRSPEERGTLEEIIRDAGACLRETRRSVAGLRSPEGPESGLGAAIAQAARHITEAKNIRLKLKLGKSPQGLPADVEYNLLRIVSEAVSNSVKHSGARVIEVALNSTPEVVRLSVKDDGSGFAREGNGNVRPGHYGLIGMKERATQIGADLQLASEPGRGTTVSVVLPASENHK